jgi:hypothetical protein
MQRQRNNSQANPQALAGEAGNQQVVATKVAAIQVRQTSCASGYITFCGRSLYH